MRIRHCPVCRMAAASPLPAAAVLVADALEIVSDGEEGEVSPAGVAAFGDLAIDGLHKAGGSGDLNGDGIGHGLRNGNLLFHNDVTYKIPISNYKYRGN